MASEDVIELGSSDDEAEPASKKVKPSSKPKPKLNAMVHIPSNLHGVTIKPSTAKTNKKTTMPIIPGIEGKPITVTKVNPRNQLVNKAKVNGKPSVNIVPLKKNVCVPLVKPIRIGSSPKVGVNPITLMNKLNNSQVMINKVPSNPKEFKHPIKFMQNPKSLIRVQSPRTLNTLPPSITIKRAGVGPQGNKMTVKRPANATITNVRKKQKVAPKGTVGDVLTVELDDDESSTTTTMSSSPQWYLRPEQQNDPLEMETANNEEPDISKYIEITIEDSPVKPTSNKRTCEVGAELAITIEDSPVKLIKPKPSTSAHSDDEQTPESSEPPQSKKKLEYPKETETSMVTEAIEIEIEPIINEDITKGRGDEHLEESAFINEPILIEDTPVKKSPNISTSTPKKDHMPNTKVQELKLDTEKVIPTEPGEFHSAYQTFIDLCLKLEDSDDMKKIVEKKIKGYYRQVPKEYTESEEFIDMVTSKIISIKAGPEKMYLYIKDIVDELNLQRKMTKTQILTTKETKSAEPDKFPFGEESEYDSKRQRQIRKLEKTLKKLHRAIQKLEEQEVDFDDDEDSVYLLTERYKERMVRVHAKFCQLTNTKMPSEPRLQIDARPGTPSGPAKRLEKWVNKKVPIGTPLPFPDFHDVLRCVREANDEDKLGWNEADIMEEARDLFTRCGKKLQRRRQENEWRLAASRIAVDIDPAEQSDDLKKKLEDNKKVATKKETEVFNKYADRQSQLKLEAVEIGDKEAEESPVESEDEEPVDESSSALENKEKRKERIRRIINEKSKKNGDQGEPKKSQDDQSVDLIMAEAKNDEKNENIEIDASASKEDSNKINEEPEKVDTVHSVSDESNQVESEVDELHLLQKLHSGNEINSSTLESSDTDTPIDISDTIQSSSDNKDKQAGDVISIENSSYSESEVNKDTNTSKEDDAGHHVLKKIAEEIIKETVEEKVEVETSSPKKRTDQTNNDEYNDSVENILLASSDDEPEENKDAENESPRSDEACVNLKDDAISIGETVVEGVDQLNNDTNTQNKNVDKVVSELKEAQNDDSSQEILFVSQEDKQEVTLNGAKNVDDSQEAQNDDSSQEIVFVSEEDKEVSLSPLTGETNSNQNTNSTRLSAVQTMEVCEESEEPKEIEIIRATSDIVNSVSKSNANSEETMEIIDVRETENDNATTDTNKEKQDCGKDKLPESSGLTKSLVDKNDEDTTERTSNDKQETSSDNDKKETSIDYDQHEISTHNDKEEKRTDNNKQETSTGNDKLETSTAGNDKQETTTGNDTQETSIGNDEHKTSTRNDKQETSIGNDEHKTSTRNNKQETSTDYDKQETSTGNDKQETNIGNDEQETSTGNDKQETVDILISEIQNLEPIEPLEVPDSIMQNNEQLLNGTDSHDIL